MGSQNKSPNFVGIAGGTASGKTTLAKKALELSAPGLISIIYLDSYYHSQDHIAPAERARRNYDHPDAFEFDLLHAHLEQLKGGESVHVPVYDYANHTRAKDTILVNPTEIVVVEGILSLVPDALRKLYKLKVFVEVESEVRLERRIARDIAERGRTRESVLQQWSATVEPMFKQFCEPTKKFAEMLVSGKEDYSDAVNEIVKRGLSKR